MFTNKNSGSGRYWNFNIFSLFIFRKTEYEHMRTAIGAPSVDRIAIPGFVALDLLYCAQGGKDELKPVNLFVFALKIWLTPIFSATSD